MKTLNAAAVTGGESLHVTQRNDNVMITHNHKSSDQSTNIQAMISMPVDLFNRFIDAVNNARNEDVETTFEISFGDDSNAAGGTGNQRINQLLKTDPLI
jgi:hypothetical protein